MKAHKFKITKNSLYILYLKSFLIFSLIVFLIVVGIYMVFSYRLDNVWNPTIGDLLDYSDALYDESFSSIPLQRFKNSSFIVLDEDCNIVYRNNKLITEVLTQEDVLCIPSYEAETYYTISEYDGQGKTRYFISKKSYGSDGIEYIEDFCLLDDSFNIISGSLFPEETSLSKKNINLLLGKYNESYSVSKTEYTNLKGQVRTLVFFFSGMTLNAYNNTILSIYNIWWLFIPMYLALLIISVLMTARKIRVYISPLNDAIIGYARGEKTDMSRYTGPDEFYEIAKNFGNLVNQLEQSEKERRRLDADKQRMLTDISHDLKTPITVIQGYSKALCDNLVPEAEQGKYFETIYRKTVALADLTNSFFEYSKLEHPDFLLDLQKTDVCGFCREYLAEKYQEIEQAGFELNVELPDEEMLCNIDVKMFRRVLENIVSNALKYNPKKTVISVNAKQTLNSILLYFADNGVGIPRAISSTVFEPFVVGDAARGAKQGTGLGMAIAKKIIAAHGGEIKLVPTPEKGLSTEFEITLPRADI